MNGCCKLIDLPSQRLQRPEDDRFPIRSLPPLTKCGLTLNAEQVQAVSHRAPARSISIFANENGTCPRAYVQSVRSQLCGQLVRNQIQAERIKCAFARTWRIAGGQNWNTDHFGYLVNY